MSEGQEGQVGGPAGVGGQGGKGGRGERGGRGGKGETGQTGPRGLAAPGVTQAITVLFILLVVFSMFFGYRTSQNTHRIDENQWKVCTALNADAARSNRVLESAIKTEQERTKPNARAIEDFENFKRALLDCGPRP